MSQAQTGNTVQVHYTGTLSDGSVFDSSLEREPLTMTLGEGQVIPGFEQAVVGMKEGETVTVTIEEGDAYGEHRSELVAVLDREQLPNSDTAEVGIMYELTQQDGAAVPVTVTALDEKTVTLDANHPLAGKSLTFEITLVSVDG